MFRVNMIFERPVNPPPLVLTELDEAILRHVKRHRFLRANQIHRLLDLRETGVNRRLEALFQSAYLDRPRAQTLSIQISSRDMIIYGLAKRGVKHLHTLGEVTSLRIHEKRVGQLYLDHTIEVAEFMTRLEKELPFAASLSYEDEGNTIHRSVTDCSWSVPIVYREEALDVGVVPDRVFRINTRDESLVFCLEVDRGTMPVVRSNPAQSSFYRKLLAYHETWRNGIHLTDLGWRRFRVLTLTSSKERRNHLVEVCREVVAGGGSGLFMFADKDDFSQVASLPALSWIIGDGENLAKILSETRS